MPTGTNGEGGIRYARFPDPLLLLALATQVLFWQRLALRRLLLVVTCCLGLLGVSFSTLSAHASTPRLSSTDRQAARPCKSLSPVFKAATLAISQLRICLGSKTAPAFPGSIPRDPRAAQQRRVHGRRRGPRSREDIDKERRELWEKTQREIDKIAAEFHALLPREQASAIGTTYARYSTRFQASIADQVRSLYELAIREGIFVPREFVHFDLAARGYKQKREGLSQIQALLDKKAVQALLVFATNRLHRKTYRALQFVEEKIVERGIRCLFKNGVDTRDSKRWRALLNFHASMDEFVVEMYGDNIRAAHEGLFLKLMVFGTISFGYKGDPIPGQFTKRGRPRCRIVIDEEAAKWVRQVFAWYTGGKPIDEIVRELNADEAIPVGPRSISGAWNHDSVRDLLANPRYRGWWAYGKTETIWVSAKDYARQLPRQEPLREAQFEELRIVSDEVWFKAQQLLAEERRRNAGRKSRDGQRQSRPKLLNGFFWCPTHCRSLYPGGPYGKSMFCKACRGMPADQRPLFSLLNRVLALELTCCRLAELVRGDSQLVQDVIAACQQEAGAAQRPDPAQLPELKARCNKLAKRIQFVLANSGDTDPDREEAARLLRELRAERQEVANKIALLEAAQQRQVEVPTESQVLDLLKQLDDILVMAAQAKSPEEVHQVREVVRLLTGGRIELVQQGERKAWHGWLQGRFRVRLVDALFEKLTGAVPSLPSEGIEVVIDYREPNEAEQWADRAKALYDAGMLVKQIAVKLNINRNLAHDAVEIAFERLGQQMPDGRSRRSTLDCKHLQPPKYQEIAEEVMRLYREGLLLGEIADRIPCDRNTVTKTVEYWHTSRGLPVPDGRTRRKELPRKSGRPDADPGPDGGTAAA